MRRVLIAAASRRRRQLLLGSAALDVTPHESTSTLTNGTFAPTANGVTTATFTYTCRNAAGDVLNTVSEQPAQTGESQPDENQ